ncbi:hypothetical protein P9X15_02765 [Bacillus cereus]|nr:hypothetical protein [Bacillus cereus]
MDFMLASFLYFVETSPAASVCGLKYPIIQPIIAGMIQPIPQL